jgi:hypothetical protein
MAGGTSSAQTRDDARVNEEREEAETMIACGFDVHRAQITFDLVDRHDVIQLIPLIGAIPAVAGTVRPRRRPDRVSADRAYDSKQHRRQLRKRGIAPEIARRKTPHGSGLGRQARPAEGRFGEMVTLAGGIWLKRFAERRILVR